MNPVSFVASTVGILASFLFLGVANTFANGQEFLLRNHTGKEVQGIYIGPMNSERFGEDVATGKTIRDGESVRIRFRSSAPGNRWEMQVSFTNGTSTAWNNLDLSRIKELTISYRNGEPIATSK